MLPEISHDELLTRYAFSIVEQMKQNPALSEEEFCDLLSNHKKELYTEIQKLMRESH